MANLASAIEESGEKYILKITGAELENNDYSFGSIAATEIGPYVTGVAQSFLQGMDSSERNTDTPITLPMNMGTRVSKSYFGEVFVDASAITSNEAYDSTFGTTAKQGYVNAATAPFANLTKVTIINRAKVGDYFCAFASSLREVHFDGVVSLGSYAFRTCDSLTTLVLPSSLTSVGPGFLMYCANIQELFIPETTVPPTDQESLTAISMADSSYVNGIVLRGPGARAWKEALPDLHGSTYPYRKLILDPAWA